MRPTVLICVLALAAGCTNSDNARRVLQGAGYTEVKVTGYRALACSEDDSVRDGFEAKGPSGQRVTGAVCCGFYGKACTIRID